MLASALNFAIGFFGYPFEGQYQQLITIEANGVSCFFFFSLPCLFVRCGFVSQPSCGSRIFRTSFNLPLFSCFSFSSYSLVQQYLRSL
jgi:hypothetical protein